MRFPRNETWDFFVEAMKYADVWYDVIDSKEVGEILDYMYKIMAWVKERGIWGEENLEAIKKAKEYYEDE